MKRKQSKRQMGNRCTIKGAIVEPAIVSKQAIVGKRAIDVAQAIEAANGQSSHHQRGNHQTGNRLQSSAIEAAIEVVPSKGQSSNRQLLANGQSSANGQSMKCKQSKRQIGNRCTIKGATIEPSIVGKQAINVAQTIKAANGQSLQHYLGNR